MPGNSAAVLSVEQACSLLQELTGLWEQMTARPPDALDVDLELLARWFHPKRGSSTLLRLMQLAPTTTVSDDMPSSFVTHFGEHLLVTPEGRIGIERLRNAVRDGRPIPVEPDAGEASPLLDLYREWSRHSLTGFSAKVEGRAEQPFLVAIGAALLTAACGWTSEASAVEVPADTEDPLAIALRRCVEAFADSLGGEPRNQERRSAQFDGYPTQKAEVRLAGVMIRRRDAGGPMRIWLDGDRQDWVLERCAQDLRRRGTPVAGGAAVRALERMLDEVDRQGAVFDAAGVSRPRESVRREFVARATYAFTL
ncbi:MAG TPA: hypothetical protein VF549_10005 [Solirubrobacteraceae bacterium]|jgi:hypothetical protein